MNRRLHHPASRVLFTLAATTFVGGCTGTSRNSLQSSAGNHAVRWSGNGHWYEAVVVGKQGISWTDAQAAAKARGGYLATLTSAAENQFVFGLVANNDGIWEKGRGRNWDGPWLGGFQKDKLDEPAGHWAWVTGEPWEYTNWSPGEPNNYYEGMEDYLQLLGTGGQPDSRWNDVPVNSYPQRDEHVLGYIVEWDKRPS